MVVEPDKPYEGHSSTWNVKIKRIFIYEFYGEKKVFFQGDFYNTTTLASSFALAFKHNTTNMVVL
jgi:hypothetical protein